MSTAAGRSDEVWLVRRFLGRAGSPRVSEPKPTTVGHDGRCAERPHACASPRPRQPQPRCHVVDQSKSRR